jgi:hypothetical protein
LAFVLDLVNFLLIPRNYSTKLNFVLAFSDKLNVVKEYWEDKSLLDRFNEAAKGAVTGPDWSQGLEREFLVDFSRSALRSVLFCFCCCLCFCSQLLTVRFYKYRVELASDLLRFIRNKSLHYREAPISLKQNLSGKIDAENSNVARDFVRYFLVRQFPLLLMVCYDFARSHFCDEPSLAGFVDHGSDA